MFPQAALFTAENQEETITWPGVVIFIAMMAFGAYFLWLMSRD
jgi:hypothetical protein